MCIRSLFHSSFFESTFPPNWFHFSPAKISDIFFLHSKNLKPRLSLENELRSKRELVAGLFLVKSKMRFAVLCIFVYFNSFSRILIICNGGDREALQILRNTAVLPEKFFCKQSPRFLLSFTTVFPTPCIHRSTHSPLPVIRG